MRSLILPFAFFVAVAPKAMALSYWVDSLSCTGDKAMDEVIKETKSLGKRASERLKSSTDTDFEHVYEFLMQRQKSDAAGFKIIEGKRTYSAV
jgi:hypothetical protein